MFSHASLGRPVTRRAFCHGCAAGAALAVVGGAAPAEKLRLRYALASSLYGTTKLAEILPELRRADAEAIDLWPRPHGDQREQFDALGRDAFRKLLDTHGARLGMTTRYDLGPLRLQDELRLLRDFFGGRLVVSGSVGPKNVAGPEAKAAVAKFVEQMKPHLAVAEECRVAIGIENHVDALIHTPDSIRYLAELSPSPYLGIALAPYHLPQDAKLLAGLIADLGPKLLHFYAWQHGRGCMQKLPTDQMLEQLPGRGPLDFAPLLAALAKIGYRGWTEVFMHPVPRGIAILDTTAAVTAAVNRACKYLEEHQP